MKELVENYPDGNYQETIPRIIIQGAKIGYCGPKQKIINSNLPSATNDPNTLIADFENQPAANWLTKISDTGDYFISSPLGPAPNSMASGENAITYRTRVAVWLIVIFQKSGVHWSIQHLMKQ